MSVGCGNINCRGFCYDYSGSLSSEYIPVTVIGTSEKVRICSTECLRVCVCCGAAFDRTGTRVLGMTNGGKQPCGPVGERDGKEKIIRE